MQSLELRGKLQENHSLAAHTSWRVGGAAQRYYQPADLADLQVFLSQLPEDEPLFWLGLGSNILVRDGGFKGTVIATLNRLNKLEIDSQQQTVYAEAGVTCSKLARNSAKANLIGGGFLAGIPGTIGGALKMNAGAFGGETWPHVQFVDCLNHQGALIRRSADEYKAGYRSVIGPENEWFVAAGFVFKSGDGEQELEAIRALLDKRQQSQPIGLPTAGSTFRNPQGNFAAKLIQDCGLKGYKIGGAEVSPKHANFIVNTGGASSDDIEALIELVQQRVFEDSGIKLQPEVEMVGDRL
ncbi:UDP-N-acetylmuramate dehydrogenase [Pelagibaculum spongiae]|uniref:UDP-N-acetylenolpyruvoylglucosamine reductase n=1 Tax=Pelagibaculum spongiae TaxID=2080658 RepID=A0A2V1H1N9_9GAMM|nr:UDP-N-acetylmuramate dehydrogenase [Pelagibaculum spongiae]PVZ71870.1 UDP-N-acetylenolpyruvoylglucosamine reductase [Pelagibaculum spongiae]